MPTPTTSTNRGRELRAIATSWCATLQDALDRSDLDDLGSLFDDRSYWRDLLAFTWDVGWVEGGEAIATGLREAAARGMPRGMRISERRTPPRLVRRAGREVLEFFVQFETAEGLGEGVVRLLLNESDPTSASAWTFLTMLRSLHEHPERSAGRRTPGTGYDRSDTRVNWLDRRQAAVDYDEREPEVLIVGGGHSGVMAAAYLTQLGVDA